MNEASVKLSFAEQVDAAVKLRDFIVSERHSYRGPDKIVDDIEAARQIAMSDRAPTADERASLSKVYRDLILIPDTSIAYDGVPPADFCSRGSPWVRSIYWLCVAPAVFLLLWVNRWLFIKVTDWTFAWHLPVIYAVMSACLIWGLFVFTGVVTDKKLNHMIGTCYGFTVLSLALSVGPFMLPDTYFSNAKAEIGLMKGCAEGADKNIPQQVTCNVVSPGTPPNSSQWVLNIGGLATQQESKSGLYKISGGLVVPLYVVVLALFGSAVSMTRRVPEYQRRAMSAADPLTNVEVREKLVFQVMQVVSAPLIAVTAFSVVKPVSISEAVIVGFGSGFASEPILLTIRGLVEKISPTPSAPATSVAVKVSPSMATLKPGETTSFAAQVVGVSNTAVAWHLDPDEAASGTISKSGLYTAPASLTAERNVTVTAISAADLNKSGSASIKLMCASAAAVPLAPIALAGPSVAVTMKPAEKRRFTATVAGDPAAPITWVLQPADAASGTLVNGDYTAPSAVPAGPIAVVAQKADQTLIGSALITIAP